MTPPTRDIANLTPEESFKAGLPMVLQLEAWVARAKERLVVAYRADDLADINGWGGALTAYEDALALVTAKDRDLGQ